MIDALGRHVDHMRVSLTNRCNLNCVYCHMEGNSGNEKEMTTDEVFYLLEEAKDAGMKTLKLTGGEPLLRDDIVAIIRYARTLGYQDVSLTTNGTLLPKKAERLKKAGLERVNIGCDTMGDSLPKNTGVALKSINAAHKAGISVKLNMVVMKGQNENEILDMLRFCKDKSVNLQLIELVNLGNDVYKKYFYSLADTENKLNIICDRKEMRDMQRRNRYYFRDMFVEIVRPGKQFCKECNKIRITTDGKIKNCLMKDTTVIDFKNRWSIEKACSMRDSCGYD